MCRLTRQGVHEGKKKKDQGRVLHYERSRSNRLVGVEHPVPLTLRAACQADGAVSTQCQYLRAGTFNAADPINWNCSSDEPDSGWLVGAVRTYIELYPTIASYAILRPFTPLGRVLARFSASAFRAQTLALPTRAPVTPGRWLQHHNAKVASPGIQNVHTSSSSIRILSSF